MESERNCTFTRLYSRSRYGAETQAVTMSSTTPCPQEAAVEEVVPRPATPFTLSPTALPQKRHHLPSGPDTSAVLDLSIPTHNPSASPTGVSHCPRHTSRSQPLSPTPRPLEHGPDPPPASRGPLSTRPAPGSPPGLSTASRLQGPCDGLRPLVRVSQATMKLGVLPVHRPFGCDMSSGVTCLFECFAHFFPFLLSLHSS